MNSFDCRVEKIKAYWAATFGKGPAFESCVALAVALLVCLYVVGLLWMIPFSIAKAFTK